MRLIKTLVISIILFTGLFWVVGNPIRDSILTPSPEAPRFAWLKWDEVNRQGRAVFLKSSALTSSKTPNIVWYLPDFKVLFIVGVVMTIIGGNFLSILLLAFAANSAILYFFVEHTFWPGNSARFLLFGYQSIGLVVSLAIVHMLKTRNNLRLVGILMLLVISPTLYSSSMNILDNLPSKNYSNFSPVTVQYPPLIWARQHLPYNSKIYFVDGFLYGKQHSDLILHGVQGFGLFIPTASAKYKMHTQEFGPESIDVINSLDPVAMKQLQIEYLYVGNDQVPRLPAIRQSDLRNTSYFSAVYSDGTGIIFKVNKDYYDKSTSSGNTIRDLIQLVPQNSSIFVGKTPSINYYVRSAILLELKDRRIYSVWGSGHYNYVETFIKVNLPESDSKYDYLLLGRDDLPSQYCASCVVGEKIWQIPQAALYPIKYISVSPTQ